MLSVTGPVDDVCASPAQLLHIPATKKQLLPNAVTKPVKQTVEQTQVKQKQYGEHGVTLLRGS